MGCGGSAQRERFDDTERAPLIDERRRARRGLFDCRWLTKGGPGRTTELALRGLAASPPADRWLLWGPEAVAGLAWAEAEVRLTASDPRALAGQRALLSVPRSDVAVFFHQLRPLRRARSLTVIHDTIPLRFASTERVRRAKERFFRLVADLSTVIVAPSAYSKACIRQDLGVAGNKIVVLPYPFDDALSARVTARRRDLPTVDMALFVGRLAPHKNIPRLIAAYARTEMARQGGRLVLVGGSSREAAEVLQLLAPRERSVVEIRPSCSQAELERLLASCRLVVQPSLEEGFGLPAWEALCCGVPVCVSDGGALPEITRGLVDPFPARSVEAMTEAIDDCAERARASPGLAASRAARLRQEAPSVAEYGQAFLEAMERARH